LIQALDRLAESDPFLGYEQHEESGEIRLNFFGEVQIEILEDILIENYGIQVEISPPLIIYRERPASSAEALIGFGDPLNNFPASLGLSLCQGKLQSGLQIISEVKKGDVPIPMWNGIYDGIAIAMKQGLQGWQVTDISVSLTSVRFSPDTSPADFRKLAPLVIQQALAAAGTELLWPMLNFELELPEQFYGKAVSDLLRMKAEIQEPLPKNGNIHICGTIPLETSRTYQLEVTNFTGGRGTMSSWFSHHEPIHF
jgi:ribosomal protection tetracycline resistance protein